MAEYYQDEKTTIHHGDCLEVMADMPAESIDAIITDPPYGLGFMGREWDALPPGKEWAEECLRVLKPGGHLLAFGGSRTWHRLAVAIEDGGFEMRDSIAWLYGAGFPKSLDVSKAIDKGGHLRGVRGREFQAWLRQYLTPQQVNAATGTNMGHHLTTHPTQPAVATADLFDRLRPLLPAVPERIERLVAERTGLTWEDYQRRAITGKHVASVVTGDAGMTVRGEGKERRDIPATPDAARWQGWGTALKPAFEPVVVARKPFQGTVAANVLEHGTGAINVDATRIGGDSGRWPANVVLDESQAEALDGQSGYQKDGTAVNRNKKPDAVKPANIYGTYKNGSLPDQTYGAGGGASRFFYIARKDNECLSGQSSSTVSTAEMSSSGEGQPPASAPNGAATSERHDTGKQTGSPSTSETQNGSKPNATTDTPTTPTIESVSSPEQQHASTTLTRDPANSAEPNPQTDTMTTTTSHWTSDGSAESVTSSTTQKSRELGDMDSGDSSRFMYVAKAPKRERPNVDGTAHPTVKPLSLMQWLVRLVTPPGGTVLDPFAGSGTTIEAALTEGFNSIGIELTDEYLPLIEHRIRRSTQQAFNI